MKINKDEKSRLCLSISNTLNNRLETDSVKYGITKTAIVTNAIVDYYRNIDSQTAHTKVSEYVNR